MAAGLGFKTFNTGDVLSAGDTNGYLMQGVLVFADAAARTAAITSPQEGQTSYLKDTDVIQVYSGSAWVTKSGAPSPLTTKGDLYTYSTTDARLGVGTNGQTLVADSTAATGLAWASPAGGGKIAQVVQGASAGFTSITTTSFMDTGMSVTITPSSATSKVMIFAYGTSGLDLTADNQREMSAQIERGGTSVWNPSRVINSKLSGGIYPNGGGTVTPFTIIYLDSPATTSAITYKLQMKVNATASTSAYFCNGGTGIMQAMEVLA